MAGVSTQETSDTGFSLKCIKDKWISIAVTVIITALIIAIIALAAKKPPLCPSCPPHINGACPDRWVGFQRKCFYFSETDVNWNASQIHCSSLNATLALIDSIQELNFTLRYKMTYYHWIGLHREQGQPWKWSNGTVFNNLFLVKGEGQCAFLNSDGVGSSRCFPERRFICNRWDECSRRKLSIAGGDTISKIT